MPNSNNTPAILHKSFLFLASSLLFVLLSCSRNGYDQTKITHRPRIYIEGAAPVPIIDEYDISSVQLGSFTDIFSADKKGRVYGVWVGLDRRAAMSLQKETSKHIGRNFNLVVKGKVIGFHPVESTITSGFIPFIFTSRKPEEETIDFYKKLENSVRHIKLEIQNMRN